MQNGCHVSKALVSNPKEGTSIVFDEFRMRTGTLQPGWIETEYRNQSNPSSFYVVHTTGTSTPSTARTYTYNPLGNILTKSDQGTYTYGQGEYTNPHAATQIHTSAFDYDQNGNLTVSSVPNTILPPPGLNTSPGFAPTLYTWSYRNELLSWHRYLVALFAINCAWYTIFHYAMHYSCGGEREAASSADQ